MSGSATIKQDLGSVATALGERLPEADLDRLLAERHGEIEALLQEARDAKRRGDVAPLEPLHAFLRRARERFAAR